MIDDIIISGHQNFYFSILKNRLSSLVKHCNRSKKFLGMIFLRLVDSELLLFKVCMTSSKWRIGSFQVLAIDKPIDVISPKMAFSSSTV